MKTKNCAQCMENVKTTSIHKNTRKKLPPSSSNSQHMTKRVITTSVTYKRVDPRPDPTGRYRHRSSYQFIPQKERLATTNVPIATGVIGTCPEFCGSHQPSPDSRSTLNSRRVRVPITANVVPTVWEPLTLLRFLTGVTPYVPIYAPITVGATKIRPESCGSRRRISRFH